MPRNSRTLHTAMRNLIALAGATIWLSTPAGAAEETFSPRVLLGQHWTDNVRLAPSGLEESEWITEFKPGFSILLDRPRATAEFDYDFQALWFGENSDLNDSYHQANGNGAAILIPQSLFIEGNVRYDQTTVDPSGLIDFSNFFDTQNRTDTFVYGASPYHVHRWGNRAESIVRYRYQGVNFTNTDEAAGDLQNSDTQFLSASLGSPQAQPGLSWRARGSYSSTSFDEAPDFDYARVEFDLGVPVSLRARATATVGRESDVEDDPTGGGLDANLWFVGFEWEPSELQQVSGRVGERYYGSAWELHWTRLGSRGEMGLHYTEEPNTSSGLLNDESVFVPGFRPGAVPALDTRVFLRKSLVGRATYNLAETTIAARLYAERLIYEDDEGGTEKYYGAGLNWDWRFAARTSVGVTIDVERRSFEAGDTDLAWFSVNLTRELSRTLSAVLRAGHQFQDSDEFDDYHVNRFSLYLVARF